MLDQMLSIRFSISLILALLFLIPSTYMLASDHGWLIREWGPREPFEIHPRWHDIYLTNRSIPSLQVLAVGLGEELSLRGSASVNRGDSGSFQNSFQFVHNPLRYLLSHLDFVFFINTIGSLMAFAFTYDAISGERQGGTLRLMMTQPIPRPLFLLSKFLGSFLSFVITLVPALTGVVLVLYLHPDVSFRMSDWGAAGLLFVMAMLYLAVVFMLGLFVSCVTKEPKTTLAALLMLWVILVLVIPNASPLLASKLRPVRSVYEIQIQMDALRRALRQRFEDERKDPRNGRDWNVLTPSERETLIQREQAQRHQMMRLNAGEVAKIRGAFVNEIEGQAKLSQYLSLISPSAGLTYLASDIAQTGLFSEWDFRRAFFRYRRQYVEYMDRYIKETGDYERMQKIDKDLSPPFEYRELTPSQAVAAYLPHSMMLVFYCALFSLGAQIAFSRTQL